MKKIITNIALLCAIAFLALPGASLAQTLTLDSVSGTHFCSGDPFSVTFSVTGMWGHDNAFDLQLSNDSGTFDNGFQDLGSVKDTAPGTFTIVSSAPSNLIDRQFSISSKITIDTNGIADTTYDTIQPTHYRLRVAGAYPNTASADNGTDIQFGTMPAAATFQLWYEWPLGILEMEAPGGTVGHPLYFIADEPGTNDPLDSVIWNFVPDAAAPTSFGAFKEWTTFSTAGDKTVSLRAVAKSGCENTGQSTFRIYDCTPPSIPNNAIIFDSSNQAFYESANNGHFVPTSYWINPGVTLNDNNQAQNDTFYAEANAIVSVNGSGNVIYLKKGASAPSSNSDGGNPTANIVIYADGASIQKDSLADGVLEIPCASLSFDYSQAPPNAVMAAFEGVAPATPLTQIELSPNPTNGIVAVQGVPVSAQVQVMNVLGVAVQQMARTTASDFTLDLSTLAAGTYYVRITSGDGVTTKKIVKE